MAAIRSRALLPVGSARWIAEERDSARQFADAEVEEFAFSVRNEMDWLNEHMEEIFNKQQLDMAEVFKTPGKLRGKTPRTAAKRNPLEKRAPLTDIFTNPQVAPSPSHETRFYQQITKIQVAEDPQLPARENVTKVNSKDYHIEKQNTDSGYHDMSSQEATQEADTGRPGYRGQSMALEGDSLRLTTYLNTKANSSQPNAVPARRERSATEFSFHSAKEDMSQDALVNANHGNTDNMDLDVVDKDDEVMREADSIQNAESRSIKQITVQQHHTVSLQTNAAHSITSVASPSLSTDGPPEEDVRSRTPSDGSSPIRPLIRKNSLKLPSLPAREPLATKKSIGARASRTSHLDQLRTNGPAQVGYHGRQPEGSKSTVRKAFHESNKDEDDSDMDEHHNDFHGRGQSDEELKMHHKSSTQRLNEQIYMLGQARPPRPTKSVSSHVASQPIYPELPQGDGEKPALPKQTLENSQQPSASAATNPMVIDNDDEDDWIPMKSTSAKPQSRLQLAKVHSTQNVEQVSRKDSNRETRHPMYSVETTYMPKSRSPLRQPLIPERGSSQLGHHISASTSMLPSPARSGIPTDTSVKQVSVSNPNLPSIDEGGVLLHTAITPAGSPTARRFVDGPASAKAKLSSMIKSAKGLFASSASVSAIAKMESFTPPSRFRDQEKGQTIETMMKAHHEARIGSKYPEGQQYQATDTAIKDGSGHPSSLNSPSRAESVMTKSSFEREDKKREKEAKEREKLAREQQQVAEQLEKAREKERQKAAAYKQERERVASQEKQIISEGIESKAISSQQPELMSKKSQEEWRQHDDAHAASEAPRAALVNDDADMEDAPAPAAGPLPSRSQVPQPSQLQKPRELRRPTRPTKATASKPKPVPVSIQVYTSQRELDHRKNGQIHPSNSTLATNLQELLPPPPQKQQQPSFASNASSASLHTVASTNSLKSSVSSSNSRPLPKPSAAAIRKKEQEEREARRKIDQKRDMERKLAIQQEEERKKEQEQARDVERLRERAVPAADAKKIAAHKQAIEKRRLEIARKAEQKNPAANANGRLANNLARAVDHEKMLPPPPPHRGELGAGRPPSRANTVGNLRLPPTENYSRPTNQPPQPNPARPPKRVHPTDTVEEQPFHRQTNAKGAPSYQQIDSKRRRTGEESDEDEVRQAMPPPKRQSNVRKDGPSKPSGYMAAPAPHMSHGGPSLLKTATTTQHHMQHGKAAHQMEMAKFANAKTPSTDNPNAMSHKTPARSVAPAKSSPRHQSGEDVELPEIPTDSEDEDSENEFSIPSWADSPALRRGLEDQELVDPEDVFGPIPTLNMEEVFRNHDRHHRFRNRTSSANWGGQDALTQEDIQAYNVERDRLIANGGWVYKMP